MSIRHRTKVCSKRSGAAVLVVLVCMAVVMALVLSWLRIATLERREFRRLEDQAQAAWLCEAGIERAAWQLGKNADYPGETWTVTAAELGQSHGGEVTIRVEKSTADAPSAASLRAIAVTADFPAGHERRTRYSKNIQLSLPATGVKP